MTQVLRCRNWIFPISFDSHLKPYKPYLQTPLQCFFKHVQVCRNFVASKLPATFETSFEVKNDGTNRENIFFLPATIPHREKNNPVRKNHVFQKQKSLFHHCGGTQKMDQFSCRPSGTFDSNCALETAPTRSWNEKKNVDVVFFEGVSRVVGRFFFCLSELNPWVF